MVHSNKGVKEEKKLKVYHTYKGASSFKKTENKTNKGVEQL